MVRRPSLFQGFHIKTEVSPLWLPRMLSIGMVQYATEPCYSLRPTLNTHKPAIISMVRDIRRLGARRGLLRPSRSSMHEQGTMPPPSFFSLCVFCVLRTVQDLLFSPIFVSLPEAPVDFFNVLTCDAIY